MAKKGPGAPKKYKTAKSLREGVDAYLDSICYQKPVIVDTPTGEVDEHGNVKMVRRMLREGAANEGRPITVTEWIEKPQLAMLCLRLGISKETWRQYSKDEKLGPVVEYAMLRMESYWVGRLDGKGAHGARFVLENNFGHSGNWKSKQEVELGERASKTVAAAVPMKERKAMLEQLMREFAAEGGDDGSEDD